MNDSIAPPLQPVQNGFPGWAEPDFNATAPSRINRFNRFQQNGVRFPLNKNFAGAKRPGHQATVRGYSLVSAGAVPITEYNNIFRRHAFPEYFNNPCIV